MGVENENMEQREIKFKSIIDNGDGTFETYIWDLINPDKSTLGHDDIMSGNQKMIASHLQFTGLLDKNGKEIYEGDRLMYLGSNMSDMVVKFENGMFVGEGPFNTHPLHTYLTAVDFVSIEVIGNIYENPELV